MSSQIDTIKDEMLTEFEQRGALDLAAWITRYPELRDELLDFAFWVWGSDPSSPVQAGTFADRGDVTARALGRVRSFLVEEQQRAARERLLKDQLAKARQVVSSHRDRGKASVPFRRAAILSWVFDVLRGQAPQISRYRTHKTVYFLERAFDLKLFTGYKKKAAGPYDPGLRYKDAEPIAASQGWLRADGAQLVAGESAGGARRYARNYIRVEATALALIQYVSELSDNQLETWTTVDAACCELLQRRHVPTVSAIRHLLTENANWRDKLRKAHFEPQPIGEAMYHLCSLGFLPDAVCANLPGHVDT